MSSSKIKLLIITAFLSQFLVVHAEELTGPNVLKKIKASYGTFEDYQDTGTVDTIFYESDNKKETNRTLLAFKTIFLRNKVFKFEYAEQSLFGPKNRYLIFSDFKTVKSWWELTGKTTTDRDLAQSLGAAAGVSGGSSRGVPSQLLKLDIKAKAFDVENAVTEGPEIYRNKNCIKIRGDWHEQDKLHVWIDSETYLVLKIEEFSIFDKKRLEESRKSYKKSMKKSDPKLGDIHEFSTKTTTTYYPQIHEKIDISDVTFNPN